MRPDRDLVAACLCRSTRHSSLTPFRQPSSDECRRWLARCLWRSPCSLLAARPGSRRLRRSCRRSQRRPVRSRPSGARGSSSGMLWYTCRDSSTTCGEGTRSRAGRSSYRSCCRTLSASISPARAASRPTRPKARSCHHPATHHRYTLPPLRARCTPPPPHYRNCCTVPACRCFILAASPAASPWLPRHRRCTGEAVGAPCGPMAQAGAGRGLPRGTGAAHAPHADEADTAPLPLVCATLDLVVHGAGARDGPHPCRDHIETKPTTHGPRGQRRSSG
jgi:hypothetical protein